ncbi:MAG: ABC transporter substrate-binding protein [Phycisphaerae bacterium]|nr:ABC transporter substrate-binding protein [Phycisphaerae bacterium]MDD5380949.1 ABC transporter substrate-binding protein [Phycisphaerae bacterium]
MNLSKQIRFRRQILFLILLVAIGTLLGSCGKKTQKVYRVGILTSFAPMLTIAEGFKAGMTELGYIEGKNIVYDVQVKDADPEGEKQTVEKFINDKVDLIFTFPTGASVTAYSTAHGKGIPMVFAMCGVEGNIPIESVAHPGRNITGVRFPGPDNVVKHLEIMIELKPQAKRVWVTYDPSYPNTPIMLDALRLAASSLGVTLVESSHTDANEVEADLQARAASGDVGIDAILLLPEALSQSPSASGVIIKFANKYHIPVGGGVPYTLDLGAVFSFLPDDFEMGKMAAPLADKIFKGTPAGSIMLATPANYLWLNYKAAQELGLTVSEGLLSRAKKIIR